MAEATSTRSLMGEPFPTREDRRNLARILVEDLYSAIEDEAIDDAATFLAELEYQLGALFGGDQLARSTKTAPHGTGVVTNTTDPLTLSVPEAAALLGVSERLVYKEIREGRFPVRTVRVGRTVRIPKRLLLEWLEGAETPRSGLAR